MQVVSLTIQSGTDDQQVWKCIIERNDMEIKMEKAKQDIGLHITFYLFRYEVSMFESPSFLQYCMFKGE